MASFDSSVINFSLYEPWMDMPTTRSPDANALTSGPTASTTPENSPPGE